MPDIEKVMAALKIHADGCGYKSDFCTAQGCPYIEENKYGKDCYDCDVAQMCLDAVTLLKEQREYINELQHAPSYVPTMIPETPDIGKIIDTFDEAKELIWNDDDYYEIGYNHGLETGKNIALDMLKERESTIEILSKAVTYHNCNNCMRDNCEYKPRRGGSVRSNCILWEEGPVK